MEVEMQEGQGDGLTDLAGPGWGTDSAAHACGLQEAETEAEGCVHPRSRRRIEVQHNNQSIFHALADMMTHQRNQGTLAADTPASYV